MEDKNNAPAKSALRQKAEELLQKRAIVAIENYSDTEILNLIHELEIHQIELEVQNDELSSLRNNAEIEAEKYTSLYDFAPCGYFTITKKEEILDLNFSGAALLGKERSRLLHKRFGYFIADKSKPVFFEFLEKIFESKTSQTCEIVLSGRSKISNPVFLTGIVKGDSDQCLLTMVDITELHKIENSLQKSQEKLEGIFNVANSGIFLLDSFGNFLLFNDWFCKSLGYTRNEFQELNVKAVSHPEDLEKSMALNQKIIDCEIEKYQIEKRYIRKDKSILWCEVSAAAIKDQNDNVVNIIKVINDITARKQSEQELINEKRRLALILIGTGAGTWEWNIQTGAITINERWAALIGYTLEELAPVTIDTWRKYTHPDDAKYSEENVEKHFQGALDYCESEFRMKHKNGNWIWILSRGAINERDINGEPLIMSGTHLDITERKEAEKLIVQSKTRFRSMINSSPIAMALNDENLNITYLNQAFYGMFGYTIAEIPTVHEWFPKAFPNLEYRKIISKSWITALETVKQTGADFAPMEVLIRCKDGSDKTIMVSATRLFNSNDTEYLINFYDITAQKHAEQALIAEKRRLALILIGTGAGTWELNIQTGALIINDRWAELFGYTIKELSPISVDTWRKHTHPKDLKIVEAFNDEYFKNTEDQYYEAEFRMKHKNGDWIWILSRGKIIKRDLNGEPLLMSGTHLDITERKEAEKAKEKAVNLFDNITNHVPGVVYQYLLRPDGSSCFPYASEAITEIYQVTPEEVREDASKIFEHIHPDDYESVVTSIQKSAKYLTTWKHEYRVKFHDGEVRHLYGNSNPQKLEDGSVLWHGYITDISENKIIENSLRESEEKYRGLVENAPYGIIIYIEDKIAFANAEVIKMAQANDKKDLIGKSVLDFVHPDSLEEIARRMAEVHRDANASEIVEAKLMTIDGIPLYVGLKAIPTVFEHKQAVQLIIQDISLQKQSAVDLNKINRVYALISQINNLIIRVHNRDELFQEICNIAVYFGKFRMSWIGFLNDDNTISTAAFAGFENGYFADRAISFSNVQEKRGPTRIALNEGRAIICNDIAHDAIMEPFREEALQRGYYSMISIPILVRDKNVAAFNLYSDEKNFFSSEEEISLLEKISLNIAFALESILVEEERKQNEQKIRQLSQAVEQSPVTTVITDISGSIEYVNPRFVEITGYTLEEVKGKNPRFLKSGHTTGEEYKKLWTTISSGQTWHGEFYNKKKDGTLYWESATISPIINAQGKATHFIAIKEDITERKIAEQELIDAKLKAEESDRLKLAFLANMSHEIRTPMNGILGFTELLKAPNLSGKEQNEFITIIEKSGQRMLNIINDIINISKVEAGQVEVTLSETNVNEQLYYIHSFFTPEANHKGIQLIIKRQLPSIYNILLTDNEKLYAVLTNLVKNAIKFTNEGSIEFGCEKKGGFLEFFVKDSGIGISDSQKSIVFERFRQASESVSRSHEGSGLGLAISKAYIEKLGGNIWVESEKGKGSTFYFTIPLQSEVANDLENDCKETIKTEKDNLEIQEENKIRGLKVLIVEDDPISKLLLTFVVKSFSKEILKVSSGIEAIEACLGNPDIDLVMMDVNMPEMGGYEATRQIREFNKDLVIIAQTANALQSDRNDAIQAGCTDYISKPINITDFKALMQKYFKK